MSKTTVFLLAFIIIGTVYFPNVFDWIWIILCTGFFIFLIVFHWMDGKGMFLPKRKD